MNLGLLNILTTQAVDKPELKRREPNGFEPEFVDDAQKSFNSLLKDDSNDIKESALLSPESSPVSKETSSEDFIDDKDKSSDFKLNLDYIDINSLPEGFNKNDLLKILGEVEDPKIIGEESSVVSQLVDDISVLPSNVLNKAVDTSVNNFVAVQNENASNKITNALSDFVAVQKDDVSNKINDKINNVLNSLLSLQEVGEEAGQIVPVADILKNFKQAVSSVSNEIAEAGLQTSPKLMEDNLQNIDKATAPLTDSILTDYPLNLLQEQDNVQQLSELGILDNLSLLDKGGVTKIADTVIQLAINEAESPIIIEGDVKSSQVESLLSNGNKEQDSTSNTNKNDNFIASKNIPDLENSNKKQDLTNNIIKNDSFIASKNISDSAEAQALIQKLQASSDNQNAVTNKLEKLLAPAQSDLSQNGFSNKDSNSNPFGQSNNFFNPASLAGQNTELVTNGDFTKFQKYMDTVSNNIKDMGALKAVRSEDVLAQIKFGLSSLGGKGDSKISIQLRPKELGSVDVRIEMAHDGKTKIAIMAEKTDTLNLLQKEAGSLRGMLQDALQTQSSDLSFSFHNQGDQQWREIIKEAFGKSYSNDIEEDIASTNKVYNSNIVATQGLDIRV